MKALFLRVLLSCALLPPGRIYLFYKGETAKTVAVYLKENCENRFVEEIQGTTESPEDEIEEMKILLSAGKEAFETVEFEKAIQNIEKALSIFRKNMIFMKDFRNIITPVAILGICYLALNRKEDALKTFKYLLSIRPDYRPPEALFPPSAMEIFLKAKKEMREFEFFFTTFPEGATVYIDGRKKGITPYMEKRMPEGTHLVTAHLQGYKEFREVINISRNENLSVILERAEVFVPEAWWGMGPDELIKMCKGRCPSPALFLYSYPESASEITGVFYSEERSSFSVMKIDEENFPASVSSFIESIFKEKKTEMREEKRIVDLSKEEERGGSKWYLWVGLGALAIGGGLGIYFGTRRDEKSFKVLITW